MASSSSAGNSDSRPANFKLVEDAISSLQQLLYDASGSLIQQPGDQNLPKMYHPDNLFRDLTSIMDFVTKLGDFGSEVTNSVNDLGEKLRDLLESVNNASSPVELSRFSELGKSIAKLKYRLPSLPDGPSAISYVNRKLVIGDRFSVDPEISSLYSRGVREHGFTTDEFTEILEGLHGRLRSVLLSFAVFPSDSVVNKRVLKNWRDGEGFVELSYTDEGETANLMIEMLVERCLIKPVREKCALIGFKMNPLILPTAVIQAEKDRFFSFDFQGNPTAQLSECVRAFLVNGEGQRRSRDELELASSRDDLDPKKLQTLFNISESYPDFSLDMFLKLRNLRVLNLGQWQSSDSDHHVELESTKFLEALKFMKKLRYFSLRGISRIFELPDSVCKLISLRILDLNACHNLEELPESIGSLKNLISLDISECYLLEKMPKSLALLTKLRILKGFLVTSGIGEEGCSFTDLDELKKLIKLSINVNRENFPNTEDFETFKKFKLLEKLAISWGGKSKSESKSTNNEAAVNNKPLKKMLSKLGSVKQENESTKPAEEVPKDCFKSLKKLNLQCYPHEEVRWLKPKHFNTLKKLCIQGGKLQKLPQLQNDDCWKKVESLHLKFLLELQLSFPQLKESFPDLTYLEVISCDKLVGFEGDESWMKKHHSARLLIENIAERRSKVVRGSIWLK